MDGHLHHLLHRLLHLSGGRHDFGDVDDFLLTTTEKFEIDGTTCGSMSDKKRWFNGDRIDRIGISKLGECG